MVHSHIRFITRFRLRLTLGSRLGYEPTFAIAIPVHPIEKNRNRIINLGCERTFKNVTLTGKMGMQQILPVTLPVKKIKGAARQHYGNGVVRCEQTFSPQLFHQLIPQFDYFGRSAIHLKVARNKILKKSFQPRSSGQSQNHLQLVGLKLRNGFGKRFTRKCLSLSKISFFLRSPIL